MATVLPSLTLVLGGARSGKSGFAERLVCHAGGARRYLATGTASDAEMQARIRQHQQDRGSGWQTIEAPLDIAPPIRAAQAGEVVLLDCLTLWLSNIMFAKRDVATETDTLLAALADTPARVVCVSNEIGMGLVPDTVLGRRFRDAQGRLNQQIAAAAGLTVFVAAGLPLVLKGKLPEGMA